MINILKSTTTFIPQPYLLLKNRQKFKNKWKPLSKLAAAPPSKRIGLSAIWAFLIAVIVFVKPGPAVTAATPIEPLKRATASAANTAFTSCLTSTILMPSFSEAHKIGDIWPPDRVNRYLTSWALKLWKIPISNIFFLYKNTDCSVKINLFMLPLEQKLRVLLHVDSFPCLP